MRIVTHPHRPAAWCVIANWFGAERIVHVDDVWGCLAYVRSHDE